MKVSFPLVAGHRDFRFGSLGTYCTSWRRRPRNRKSGRPEQYCTADRQRPTCCVGSMAYLSDSHSGYVSCISFVMSMRSVPMWSNIWKSLNWLELLLVPLIWDCLDVGGRDGYWQVYSSKINYPQKDWSATQHGKHTRDLLSSFQLEILTAIFKKTQ